MASGIFFQNEILTNSVVTDEIFGYLKRSELLECSLISKEWNKASREYLRRRHSCILHLDPGLGLEQLQEKLKIVENAAEMPFNGVHLNFGWCFEVGIGRNQKTILAANKNFKPTLQILERLPAKYVSMKFFHEFVAYSQSMKTWTSRSGHRSAWIAKRHREVFLFYMKLLNIKYIERLEIKGGIKLSWNSLGALVGNGRNFENLKHADVGETVLVNSDGVNEFLEKCPSLTEWCGPLRVDEALAFIKLKKTRAIKNILLWSPTCDTSLKQWNEIADAGLVLDKVDVNLDPLPEFVAVFKRITRWSASSLREIRFNDEFLEVFIRADCIQFENLQKVLTSGQGLLRV